MRGALLLVIVACAPSRSPSYPVHPFVRSASGGPIAVAGAVAEPAEIPYAPGLTLATALRLVGGPTGMAGRYVRLTREHALFWVELAPLIDHRIPDPELAPGDEVLVESLAE